MNTVQNKKVTFENLGIRDYKEVWDYQEELFKSIVDIKIANRKLPEEEHAISNNHLLFVEHPHVYTLGKHGEENNLLIGAEELLKKRASFYRINRGGDITYHGPGQIVGYPIIDLDNFFTDVHKYMRLLEETIIRTVGEYGLKAGRVEGMTGVWLDHEHPIKQRKICAMGVKTSRWVTMHGFALNVNTNLHYFQSIVPCGISNKGVTSLAKELGREIEQKEVETYILKHIAELFEMDLQYDK